MSLKKGDIIKTALGEHTTVLDVKKNQAVLFTGEQFVIASGIKENKEKIERLKAEELLCQNSTQQ